MLIDPDRGDSAEAIRVLDLRGLIMIHGLIPVSASTVRRWLAGDVLKPWQHRSWSYPRDPDFAAKAARVLDLYAGYWDGEPLREGGSS